MDNSEESADWTEAMRRLTEDWLTSPVGSFLEIEPRPLTWKRRFALIPYWIGYYLSYPILWLAYQIWDGIEDAYLNIWNN